MDKLNSVLKEKIKIRIIELLRDNSLSFSEILKKLELRDHGQLNYHLKILIENGLVCKNEKYKPTNLGEQMSLYVNQFRMDEMYPLSVVCSILKNEKDEILLLKRSKNPQKEKWAFPGGKMRVGESIEEAIKREVLEETGLEVKETKTLGFFPTRFFKSNKLSFHANLIIVEAKFDEKKKIELPLEEHSEHRFVKSVDLKNLDLVPANKEVLKFLKGKDNFHFSEIVIEE